MTGKANSTRPGARDVRALEMLDPLGVLAAETSLPCNRQVPHLRRQCLPEGRAGKGLHLSNLSKRFSFPDEVQAGDIYRADCHFLPQALRCFKRTPCVGGRILRESFCLRLRFLCHQIVARSYWGSGQHHCDRQPKVAPVVQ